MINALPPEGRKLLVRSNDGVTVYDRVSSSRIKTALSAGETGHTIICVEDEFSQSLLRELLRRYNKSLLSSVSVIPFGDTKAVVSAKEALQKAGFKAVAVRDADKGDNKKDGVFSLPGSLAPEKEVFQNSKVCKALFDEYGVDFKTIVTSDPSLNHHEYSRACAYKAQTSEEVLQADCIRAFLDDVGSEWFEAFCKDIDRACQL
jgi:hypothetical protein